MPYNQFAAVGEETTWGTPVARTKFMKVHEGSSLEHVADRPVSAILSGNIGGDAEAVFDKGSRGEGTLIIPSSFDDAALLKVLKHGFGLLGTSGAGPYLHTFTRKVGPPFAAGVVPTAQSLSVELNYELPDTGPIQARLLEGAMVKSFGFNWVAEEEVKVTTNFIGEQVTQVVKTASPVFPDYDNYLQKYAQADIRIDGGADVSSVVKGIEFTIDNGHVPVLTLGSTTTRQPARMGKGTVSGKLTLLWSGGTSVAKAVWDKYKANTASSTVVTINGPAGYTWTIIMNNMRFTGGTLSPEEGQLQTAEFTFMALHDATYTAIRLIASNQTATI